MKKLVGFLALALLLTNGILGEAPAPPPTFRINCFPEQTGSGRFPWTVTQQQCDQRGCTFNADTGGVRQSPPCYMDPLKIGFKVTFSCSNCNNVSFFALLQPLSATKIFEEPIKNVTFKVLQIATDHVQLKFEDANDGGRYQVPFNVPPNFKKLKLEGQPNYQLKVVAENPFSFQILRSADGTVLFDTSLGGFVFSDRFLQITTRLPSPNLYGIGEHEHPSLKHNFNYQTWPMFARDQITGLPIDGLGFPLYGTHPFYMVVENSGNAHGVFLMNSNAMEYSLIPASENSPAIVIRTIGGILDFHLYTGPSPSQVIQQHTGLVGRPYLPPYWSLGFHLSRWGYDNLTRMQEAVNRTRQYGIPLDAIYADIDHMEQKRDFTYDQNNFAGLPQYFQDEKAFRGLRSVIITDPAIEMKDNYEPWTVLNGNNSFITWPNGSVMFGHVWPPGKVAFPDFFLNKTSAIWQDLIVKHQKLLNFDGLWIDMNEPSNTGTNTRQELGLQCPTSSLDDPPYRTFTAAIFDVPKLRPGRLSDKTICMAALQSNGLYRHYDVHSLYGWTESYATVAALKKARPNRRPFILARSTFAGSGSIVSHWLGDNAADWIDLRRSITGILEMSMFGLAHTGADICGFMLDTTEKLCKRWMQLGAFYPFSRNHNTWNAKDQDPGSLGPNVAETSRIYLTHRYRFLPYLYTLFFRANQFGETVARPLFFEFPDDPKNLPIDDQFMLGPSLMVTPVLDEFSDFIFPYLPKGIWLDKMKLGKPVDLCQTGRNLVVEDTTYWLRGGSILAGQGINQGSIVNTAFSRDEPMFLEVLFDCQGTANGSLFWDDGESTETIEQGNYYLISYTGNRDSSGNVTLSAQVTHHSLRDHSGDGVFFDSVTFYGIATTPKSLRIVCPGNPDIQIAGNFDSNSFTYKVSFNSTAKPHLFDNFDIYFAI